MKNLFTVFLVILFSNLLLSQTECTMVIKKTDNSTVQIQLSQIQNITFSSSTIDSLVAYYPFNGNAYDESGHGNNGTVSGATLITDRYNQSDKAYLFDASMDYINIPDAPSFDFTTSKQLTINFWFKYSSAGVIMDKMGPGGSSDDEFDISVGSTNKLYITINGLSGTNHQIISNQTLTPNTWYFVSWVWNGSSSKNQLYINGQIDVDVSTSITQTQNTNISLRFGQAPHGGASFNGTLDEVRIYKKALSQQEILFLFNY